MWEKGNAYTCKVLVGKSEEKRPLGRPKCKWEATIKINLREVGLGGLDSSGSG
jgi:hypothetical protein